MAKGCEHKNCYVNATHRCKFKKGDDIFAMNLCEVHMTDLLINGLAYRHRLRFKVISIIPFEESYEKR